MAKVKAPKTGLTKKHWFGYMFGDWGGCMTFALMGSLFTMYCTNALGIDPTLLGTLVIIWTIWDAINDPMMGALMDKAFARKQDKRGKFRPWLLRATPLLAISAICLWTVPTFLEGIPMLIALFSFKILYEASYTMFNIPMGSLLSAMSTNDSERASLSSARGVGSMIGNMIPAMAGPVVIGLWDDRTSTGYMITGVTCAIIGFVICFLHYALTEERTSVGEDVKADDIKFSDILVVIQKNRPFVALFIHGVCICLMQYAAQTLGLYMYSGVYHDVTYQTISSALSSPFMIGSMIAVPFMCKKLGLEKLIRYSLLIGGAYLVYRKVISVRIPAAYLGTVAALTLVFSKGEDPIAWMLYSLLGGGVVLGAIFMATDYATSPVTPKGQLCYGIGCGVLTVLFRYFGLFPEGVTYAILLMNAMVWIVDYHTAPRRFGYQKGGKHEN